MKLKKFFIDHKLKIKEALDCILYALLALILFFSIYSIGFSQGLDSCHNTDFNKKELVNRRERFDSSNITYINLLTDETLNSIDYGYINEIGNFVSFDALILTNYIAVSPGVDYVYKANNNSATYMGAYDSNFNWVQTIIAQNVFSIPSGVSYLRIAVAKSEVNTTRFYQGQVVYDYYLPPIQNILDDEYGQGYENGLYDSTNNLFQPHFCKLLIKQGYLYETYGETDSTLGNGYFNKELFFKGNYLDFTYLYEALRVDGLFQIAFEFMIRFESNTRFYLSNLNLKVVPSSVSPITPVENLNLQVRTDGLLGDSSELFEFLEYDKLYRYDNRSLITTIWFNNKWPDTEVFLYNVMTYEVDSYNKGFDSGYDKGYSNGYNDGEISQDDYYNNLIIPAIKIEYEEIGYSNGYDEGYDEGYGVGFDSGYDDGFTDGKFENNAILKPFELMVKGVEPVIVVLSSEIAPGITIGTIALIPLAVTMIVFLLKGLVL